MFVTTMISKDDGMIEAGLGGITRRAFGAALGGCLAVALAIPGAAAVAARARPGRAPVIGFHADAPWLDPTGLDLPYEPAAGSGGFAPDHETLARLGHYV